MNASFLHRVAVLSLVLLGWNPSFLVHGQTSNAAWMSGQFGIGFRIPSGDWIEKREVCFNQPPDWTGLVAQVKDTGASWVIVNLSAGAFGDTWMAPHSVLSPIFGTELAATDCSTTAPTSLMPTVDYFQDILDAFAVENIKVVAYVATQGPAMLKFGTRKAGDVIPNCTGGTTWDQCGSGTTCCSPNLQGFVQWMEAKYNEYPLTLETVHLSFANDVIAEYAKRYGSQIAGWWFDHARFGNKEAIRSAIVAHNPNAAIAFNDVGYHVPLNIWAPGVEDYTGGHPNPIAGNPPTNPSNDRNLGMVTSIEDTGTGYFTSGGHSSLGHAFLPTGTRWNGVGLAVDWPEDRANEWFHRIIDAHGAVTWNLPRASNGVTNYVLLDPLHLDLVQAAVTPVVTTPSPSFSPTAAPTVVNVSSNLALGKPVTSSSRWFPDSRAVDGLDNTFTHSSCTDAPWLMVDLISLYKIDYVEIQNRIDCCGDRLIWFTVEALDEFYSVLSSEFVARAIGTGELVKLDFKNTEGVRYVRLSMNHRACLHVGEIRVFGFPDTEAPSTVSMVNLALSGAATHSSNFSNFEPSRAIDGNYDGGIITHTSCADIPWWMVTLPSTEPIYSVVLYNRMNCCGDRLKNGFVELLNIAADGSTTVVASQAFPDIIYGKRAFFFSGDYAANGVRVRLQTVECLSLAEVEVWGV